MSGHASQGEAWPSGGKKSVTLVIGTWADKNEVGHIHIRIAAGSRRITTVTNHKTSERYHRTLFRNLRQIWIEHNRWPFGEDGAETEERGNAS